MNRKAIAIILAAVLLTLGAMALVGGAVGEWLLILPAIPFAMVTMWLEPGARSGIFWDSAHSPPFLNALGLTVVYFLPGLLLLISSFFRGRARPVAGV